MTPTTSPNLDAADDGTGGGATAEADGAQSYGARGDWAQAAEARVLDAAIRLATDGRRWDERLVVDAATEAGLSAGDASLLLPEGPRDLCALLWRRHDTIATQALARIDPAALKVRARIRAAVLARVEAAAADEAAVKASAVFLARPANTPLAARLGWATADALWRWAGDTSTDENHYSKRAILSTVLASTAAVRLTRGREAAERHVDERIEGVMRFETWKAKLPKLDVLPLAAAALGHLRYRAQV